MRLKAINLAIFSTIYLLLLNTITYNSFFDFYYALPLGIIFFILLLIFKLFGNIVFKLIISIFIALSSIVIFFKYRYGVIITSDILLSGLINDKSLSSEMISLPLVIWFIFTAIIPIFLIFRVKIVKVSFRSYLKYIFISLISVFILMVLQGYKYRKKGQIRDYKIVYAIENFSPIDLIFAYKKARRDIKRLNSEYKDTKVDKNSFKVNNLPPLVVIVIGETSRGDRFSLNGYRKNTNEKLANISNLYSFKSVKSCDTLTLNSMHYIFTKRECKEYNPSPKGAPFTRVFKTFGYDIHLYTLQTINAFYQYLGINNMVGKYKIIKEQKIGTKDQAMLPYIKRDLEELPKRELLIIHTLGSHQTYLDRLSHEDIKFKPICKSADVKGCKKEYLDNTFDNTIVAVDNFLSKLIDMLKDKDAMLIYFSDHGESLGEGGVYFHGMPVKIAPKEQFNTALIFWFSNRYKERKEYKNFVKNYNKLQNRTINHDYIYHSILGCSGFESSDIKSSLNLCRED